MSEDPQPGAPQPAPAEPPQPQPAQPQPAQAQTAQGQSPPTVDAAGGSGGRPSTADRVGSILSAAESAADQIRRETEARVRDRIAEGKRAADYRVQAAEEEASEIVASARQEAEQVRLAAAEISEQAKTAATGEALTIISDARERADGALEQANEETAATQQAAQRHSQELMSEARMTADEVRKEGLELVPNLRQMRDALRANAERILRDVQSVHSQMVARIDRVQAASSRATSSPRRSNGGRRSARAEFGPASADEIPDVPEFIPPP